ncbi:hypothetical protein AN958_08961 [Leucoagaricus sp. SymC.cos]|nr:hypothetical protein AN958_08961 [Leucoagaricus sp. SymC.cos]
MVAKTTKWVLMFKRLAKPAKGISQQLMRRLYLGVAILKMTYALEVWYEPPLHKESTKRIKHLSNLHILLKRYSLNPQRIKTIHPPKFILADPIPIETKVADSREESILSERSNIAKYKIFSDRSGYKGQVGAAAVLMEANNPVPLKTLHYHLGSLKEYTTYKAEAVGAIMAVHLMKKVAQRDSGQEISHYADNQSIIKVLTLRKGQTRQYLIESY